MVRVLGAADAACVVKRERHTEKISNVLTKVIGKIGKQGAGSKEKILIAWQKVVGKRAVTHSRPVSIRKKILTIEIDSSTWMYALSLEKKRILRDLKKEMGEDRLKGVRFRIGDIT